MKKPIGAFDWINENTAAARATLIGKNRALIENHTGIIEFRDDIIRLSAKGGEVVITGAALEIAQAKMGMLEVRGNIAAINVPNG